MSADNLSAAATAAVPIAPGLRRLPFTIRLSPQFVNRLLSRSSRTDMASSHIQGLLFGLSDESLLLVQAFRSFPEGIENGGRSQGNEDIEQLLTTARKDPEISPLELVGWYTFRAHGGLLQTDIQFHDRHFKQPNDLAMVLKLEGNSDVLMELYCRSVNGMLSGDGHRWGAVRLATAATLVGPVEVTMRAKIQDDFFMRTYESEESEKEETPSVAWKRIIPFTTKKALEFLHTERKPKPQKTTPPPPSQISENSKPKGEAALSAITPKSLELSAPRENERVSTTVRAMQKISAGAPPSVPAVIPDVPRKYGIPWISSALVFAVAAGLTFGLVYSRGLSSGDNVPGFLRSFFPAPGLGLRLENQGDRVLLSWNRHHPAVSSAKGGVLQIDDGTQHRRVNLDPAQVSNGSVLYRPNSDDVTFRLEVEGTQGGRVSESMRVLEGSKPGTLDVSAPAVAPPDSRTSPPPDQTDAMQQVGPTGRSTAVISPKINAPTGIRPAPVSQEAARNQAPVQNAQTAPAPSKPVDLPAKKPDTQGEVAYDVLPPAAAAPKNDQQPSAVGSTPATSSQQTETAQLTPPATVNNTSTPTERQTPSSTPPVTERPNALPATPAPSAAIPTQPKPSLATAYRAPRPRRQVLPNVAQLAPNVLATAGRVEIIVKVSESGQVTEANVANGSRKINASLAGAALLAARQWTFEPATLGGRHVPSEHSIVFQFQSAK